MWQIIKGYNFSILLSLRREVSFPWIKQAPWLFWPKQNKKHRSDSLKFQVLTWRDWQSPLPLSWNTVESPLLCKRIDYTGTTILWVEETFQKWKEGEIPCREEDRLKTTKAPNLWVERPPSMWDHFAPADLNTPHRLGTSYWWAFPVFLAQKIVSKIKLLIKAIHFMQ